MATILKARGRMTRDLVTQTEVGDQVVSLVSERQRRGRVRVGDAGTVRKIVVSAPNDGDDTVLMYYVKLDNGDTVFLHSTEFVPPRGCSMARRRLDNARARWSR